MPSTETTALPARLTHAWWEDVVSSLEAAWISLASLCVDDPPTPEQAQRIESLLAEIHAASASPVPAETQTTAHRVIGKFSWGCSADSTPPASGLDAQLRDGGTGEDGE